MSGFEKCPICHKMMKGCKEGEVFWLDDCNDFYHFTCIQEYVNDKIKSTQFPINCANENCKVEIQVRKLEKLLPAKQYKHILFIEKKWCRKSLTNITRCPNPDCSNYFERDRNVKQYSCEKCLQEWCLDCKVPYHTGQTCEEYKNQLI